jgi:lysophospholipase L1-like esterase
MGNTRDGFAYQTVTKARKRGYDLKLVNFGCGGATTTSITERKGCPRAARGPGGEAYTSTQADAAAKFLRRHRSQVVLVTVSIGGNDVTACARGGQDPVSCVAGAVGAIKTNLGKLARQIRAAAGPRVRIVGTTYPDVILGQWVREPVNQDLAKLSVVAFKSLINPTLSEQYKAVGGRLVDVTRKTGAYGSLDDLTTLAPYGQIPVPVAQVCKLTWYCEKGDIHARKSGYGVIADMIVATLPKRG